MSRIPSHRTSLVAIAAVLSITACAKPPQEAIDAAVAAQQSAVTAGAEEYAPEAMAAVTQAKAALDAELAAQQEKMSLTRSYGHAEELAAAYQTAAQQAASAAATAKEQARAEASDLIAQGRVALEEAMAALAAAPRGKGSAADLAAFQTDLQTAGTTLADAEAALTGEQYLQARSMANSAHEVITRVKDAVAQAQTARR